MDAEGWVLIPQMITREEAQEIVDYYRSNPQLHKRNRDMEGIRRTSVNNLPPVRLLHDRTLPFIQALVPEPIKTSYSFTAQYEAGTILPKHTDRSQCVYNVSLMLGCEGTGKLSDWPLHIERPGHIHHAHLGPGDAVLYSGTRDPHWRDVMPDTIQTAIGTFLHYVPASFTGSLD